MPDGSEISPGELRRWLTRIDETLKSLVLRVEHEGLEQRMQLEYDTLERRVHDLEDGRSSLVKILVSAVIGVVVTAVLVALKTQGAAP
jgi:hypothetical protein